MHDKLERAIRELEAKLPELRRLIAEGELTFSLSPDAEALGQRLLDAVATADDAAGTLRRFLLSGGVVEEPIPFIEPEQKAVPDAPTDAKVAEPIAGLIEETYLPFATDLWQAYPNREPILPGWDVRKMFLVTEDGRFYIVLDERSKAFAPEAPTINEQRQEWLNTRIIVMEFNSAETRSAYLETIIEAARAERDIEKEKAAERKRKSTPSFREQSFTWWHSPKTFAELREVYRDGLTKAIRFYLEDDDETTVVVRATFEQAERVWDASEGEVSGMELLARTAEFQIGLLLPGPADRPTRWVPTEQQIFRQLEAYRIERMLASLEAQISTRLADARESGRDLSPLITSLEQARDRLLDSFYNSKLRLDDDNEAGGAIGVPAFVPPPQRGPGGGRTFEEALAAPRNP